MTAFLSNIIKAWPAGKVIANPKKWKSAQFLSSSILIILSIILSIYRLTIGPLPINDEDLIPLSSGIAGFIYALNAIVTKISSDKL